MTIKKITGSEGEKPILDGGTRGLITAALTSLLLVANDKSDWITDADVANLAPVVLVVSFLLWGVWDRFAKPRL